MHLIWFSQYEVNFPMALFGNLLFSMGNTIGERRSVTPGSSYLPKGRSRFPMENPFSGGKVKLRRIPRPRLYFDQKN